MKLTILFLCLVLSPSSFTQEEIEANENKKEKKSEPSAEVKKKKELTDEEKKILLEGEISTPRYISGGVVGTYLGFGVGHAIVGKYSESGWRFTAGQLISASLIVAGLSECVGSWVQDEECSGNTAMVLGIYGYVGFRIWEIYDIWTIVPGHNRKYKSLKSKEEKLSLLPVISNDKFGAFLTYRF